MADKIAIARMASSNDEMAFRVPLSNSPARCYTESGGMHVTTDQMKSFIKAAEYLNFTKAAEQLFITQSAISRQIGAMEQELSCRLFTRQNSQIRLTAEGKLLYHGLSRIYADYSTLLHTLADSSSGMSGELRLGILNDQILDPWFGELLSDFSQDRPNVRISLQRLELQKLNAGLSQGDLDIAITLFRGQDGPEGCEQYVYALDQMYLAVPRRLLSPGADPDAETSFESILATLPMTMIAPESFDSTLTPFAWNVLNNKIIRTEIRFEPDMEHLTDLVTSGLYFTVANESNVLSLYPDLVMVKAHRFGQLRKGIRWMKASENPLVGQFVSLVQTAMPSPLMDDR